ncbi:MAG: hypothetical protein H6R14_1976 [Proteobacteria bacterium]|nr:hypothetical protein [Pseudomonadota bacterium]
MTETLFCYCCRVHHDKSQMRRYPTRQGYRWRCLRSIEAAASSLREREAFGQKQSALNREAAREAAERGLRLRRMLMAAPG